MDSTKLHVAIIMDGNGRWATSRGKPRSSGHLAGADAVRRVVEAAVKLDVGTLTLFAFSADNWKRPAQEVSVLMRLLRQYLRSEVKRCVENGVRLRVIGRRDRLNPTLVSEIEHVEATTRSGERLLLRIAVDYSARETILRAAKGAGSGDLSRTEFAEKLGSACHDIAAVPDVDLLIRTGGEQRLSDFLLWECAYAELLFTPTKWPDFGEEHLAAALDEYRGRDRRFGCVSKNVVKR